jgi:hypothetical protein
MLSSATSTTLLSKHASLDDFDSGSVLTQTLANALAHTTSKLLILAFSLLTEQLGRIQVGGALVVGLVKQGQDADEDGLGGLDRAPTLGSALVAVLIVLGRVQDGDAELAVGVYVGVEGYGRLEDELGWHVRVLGREAQGRVETATWNRERQLLA